MSQRDPPDDLTARFATGVRLSDSERTEEERRLRAELKARQIAPEVVVEAQTDETLAVALRTGFFLTEVYDELPTRYERRVHSWLIRWGVEYNKAFDLVQDTLVYCLLERRLDTYDPDKGKLSSYLRVVAWNQWRGSKRGKGNKPGSSLSNGETPEPMDHGPSPDEILERAELTENVAGVLAQLPRGQGRLIELTLAGRAPLEMAQELGIPVESVYGRLNRARMHLAELMGIVLPLTDRGRPPGPRESTRIARETRQRPNPNHPGG